MEPGFEKWLSPSKSTASPKPSSTRENNENDPSQLDKIIPKSQNQNKPFVKHFMSPTISAASKAAPPRNKILTEHDENSFIPDFQIPKPEKKKYDPLTNYLSPRPKYLRFNPNRRREIFNRLEKEELNDNSSSDSHSEEVVDHEEESVVNPENEENNNLEGDVKHICNNYEDEAEEEEEEEEEEEDRGWRFKEVLKFVLTLIAFVLSTSYICTMNSSQQEGVWPKVKDGFLMVKKQTLEVASVKMWGTEFLKVKVGDDYIEFEEGGFEAGNIAGIIDDDVENSEVVEMIGDENREIEESINFEAVENNAEISEVVEVTGEENWEIEESINLETEEKDVENSEVIKRNGDENREIEEIAELEAVENDVENLEVVEIVGGGNLEIEESVVKFDNELAENEIVDSDQSEVKAGNFDLMVDVKPDVFESSYSAFNEDNAEKNEAAKSEVEPETENYEQWTAAKTNESGNADKNEPEMEMKGSDQLQELKNDVVDKSEKVGPENEAVIFGVFLILASLAIVVYQFKKSRIASAEKSEMVVVKSHQLAAAVEEKKKIEFIARPSVLYSSAEKSETVVVKPHKLAAAVEEKKKIEFIARPSVLYSTEEAPRKLDRFVYAPSVELIGEIDVGRASNAKNNKPVLAPTQMFGREFSNFSSRSFGSFTTETTILQNEGGQSAERAVEFTPVRRSSRLRSRAAAT